MSAAKLTAWVAIAMAWCAGFVDGGVYNRLSQTFTSHMTGNTAHLGRRMVAGEWQAASNAGWAILCFVIGLFVSATLQHVERREGIRSAFSSVLALEVVFLGIYIWLAASPSTSLLPLIFFPAAAMGMQTVTITQLGKLRIYTTFLTGNLSKFSEKVTWLLFWAWDHSTGRLPVRLWRMLRVPPQSEALQHAAVSIGLWMAFLAGAVCGVAAGRAWGAIELLFPMAVLAAIIPVDLRCPKELESEEQ